MKIALISTMNSVPWGGSEELWSHAAARLLEKGETVGVNVMRWPEIPAPIRRLEEMGCVVQRRTQLGRAAMIHNALLPQAHFAWLDRFQPDFAVVSQGANIDGAPWMLACKKRSIPYVSVAHSAGEQWWPDDREARRIAEGYEGARAAYFVSQGNLDLTRRQLANPLENASIVRNPFNVDYDIDLPWPASENGFRLACVGRLAPIAKGQDMIFEVLRQEKWRNRPIHVSFYGSGPNERTLQALSDLYQLSSITFAGFHSNASEIWRDNHALILPSRFEGLPLVVVEAMLSARVCIVTDVAGNKELMEDGISGFVARAPSVSLLDEAMERAWTERAIWEEIGKRAAIQVRTLVPRDPIEDFVNEIYHQISGQTIS